MNRENDAAKRQHEGGTLVGFYRNPCGPPGWIILGAISRSSSSDVTLNHLSRSNPVHLRKGQHNRGRSGPQASTIRSFFPGVIVAMTHFDSSVAK